MRDDDFLSPHRPATRRADTISIWISLGLTAWGGISAFVQGYGMALSLLIALGILPLAFLTAVLLPRHRQITAWLLSSLEVARKPALVEDRQVIAASAISNIVGSIQEIDRKIDALESKLQTVGDLTTQIRAREKARVALRMLVRVRIPEAPTKDQLLAQHAMNRADEFYTEQRTNIRNSANHFGKVLERIEGRTRRRVESEVSQILEGRQDGAPIGASDSINPGERAWLLNMRDAVERLRHILEETKQAYCAELSRGILPEGD